MNYKLLSLFPMAAAAAGCSSTAATTQLYKDQSVPTEKSPNVVFFLVDDISYFAVSCYGAKEISVDGQREFESIKTPNIDRVAEQGVICNHAYACPLSEATRVALMTGMNNGRNFVQCKALHDSQITFGDVFQRNGYETGMYGKWKQSRGTAEIPGKEYLSAFGWDDYCCFDVVDEVQRYINPYLVTNDEIESYLGRDDLDPMTGRRWYGPDIFNRHALAFLNKNYDKPFFLYYPLALIHDEHRPTPDTQPYDEFDTMPETTKYNKREYMPDMIRYADKMIGRIVDRIDELGIRENTLIVIMGDNGNSERTTLIMENGDVHIGGKGGTDYQGEQVPLILSLPGSIAQGAHYDAMIDLTDIYPTIMEAANMVVPNANDIDGKSFYGQITGRESEPHRDYVYKWYNANKSMDDHERLMRYAHDANYKYYTGDNRHPEGRFFDLTTDRAEEAGGKAFPLEFQHFTYYGLDLDKLTPEQQKAMKELEAVTAANEYKAVESIAITDAPKSIGMSECITLGHQIIPQDATVNNVIWESSDPSIAKVNKFGDIIPISEGDVTITLYSWDDARPVAAGPKSLLNRSGMKSSVDITITK